MKVSAALIKASNQQPYFVKHITGACAALCLRPVAFPVTLQRKVNVPDVKLYLNHNESDAWHSCNILVVN